jgi:acyl carrier protein
MDNTIDTLLAEVFTRILGRRVAPGETVIRENEPQWDSLKHMEMIFLVEDALGVFFDRDEIAAIASSDALREKLEMKRAA